MARTFFGKVNPGKNVWAHDAGVFPILWDFLPRCGAMSIFGGGPTPALYTNGRNTKAIRACVPCPEVAARSAKVLEEALFAR